MSQTAAEMPGEMPKDASAAVVAQHEATLKALPFADVRDFEEAARGFLGTIENAKITSAQGRVVWSLEPYGFLKEEKAPHTVDPSLWRQSRLNMNHGLFEVVPGVYQVRGFDIANMTLIEGDKGVVVIDTLTSIEGARAAMELYFRHRGRKPVTAVIFTHTHTDHWGGALGVLDEATHAGGSVPIIAPNLFMEHAVSENIIAGPAMLRRAQYQFGPFLAKGVRGHVDCGLGKSMAAGAVDGNALPLNNGKGRPRAESARIELPEPPDLSRMVEKLNEFLRQSARHLQFRYDDSSGRTVITVVDAANGDVIRQIPSDELLALAERMRAAGQPGALIDLRV